MSHFGAIDAGIVGLYLMLTIGAGLWVRRYVGKVEHFLVAGREMNVYLGIASLAATEFGVITCMYAAQSGYEKGFSGMVPGILYAVAMLFVGITGFCIKPLRQSGVITIPELLERQFGPRIRWLAGVVIVLGGLLNMGVFLRVGGEYLVYSTGMNEQRLVITMTVLLAGVALYTVLGGMLSVLVTDYMQFIVMSIGLLAVTLLVLHDVGWSTLVSTVQAKYGAGGFNPLVAPNLGWSYVLFFFVLNLSAVLTWQTMIARVLAAKDANVGQKVYRGTSMFFVCRFLIPGLWGIAALATLAPGEVGNSLHAMPKYLATLVPSGLIGLVVAAMLAAEMSTDSSYMLTWGSVIYNDILAPFRRRKPWSESMGLLINRFIVACIGVFLLVFGLWYELKGDLWTYIGVTGSIYLSSISVLLVACCYWKRATAWGAGGAILLGALFPLGYLVMEQIPATKDLAKQIGPHISGLAAYAAAALAMIIGSLLTPRRNAGLSAAKGGVQ